MKTRRLVILGSTGSIGRQTLDVVREAPDRYEVLGLAAGRNVRLLEEQVHEFRPRLSAQRTRAPERPSWPAAARACPMAAVDGTSRVFRCRPRGDGTVGRAGLDPTLAALRAGNAVALANKEVLVMAGHVVKGAAKKGRAQLIPVDSEHSAIWQCLWGEKHASISRIMLTASGGAFRDYTPERLAR